MQKMTLFKHKKEWSSHTCYDMDEPWNQYAKWNEPVTINPKFYESIYMKCPE